VNESKIELTERLRREGRWSEASLFKDAELRKLRSDGMVKTDASDEAWRRMAAKYPLLEARSMPTTTAPPALPSLGTESNNLDDTLFDFDGDSLPPDVIRDVNWVYANIANRQTKPEDAPGPGAWGLLQWARKYQVKFYETLLPKAMAAKRPEDDENIRQEKKSIDQIRAILKKMAEDEPTTEGSAG
jgi:hypothetical protein